MKAARLSDPSKGATTGNTVETSSATGSAAPNRPPPAADVATGTLHSNRSVTNIICRTKFLDDLILLLSGALGSGGGAADVPEAVRHHAMSMHQRALVTTPPCSVGMPLPFTQVRLPPICPCSQLGCLALVMPCADCCLVVMRTVRVQVQGGLCCIARPSCMHGHVTRACTTSVTPAWVHEGQRQVAHNIRVTRVYREAMGVGPGQMHMSTHITRGAANAAVS
jgi:hypothetical protein